VETWKISRKTCDNAYNVHADMTLTIYIDFVPRHLPEDVATELKRRGWEFGCLYTRSRAVPKEGLRRCGRVLVDQGLAAARNGVPEGELWTFYARAIGAAKAAGVGEIYAVVPDRFNDMWGTVELWHRWAHRLERLGAVPVLVLQQPRRMLDWVKHATFQRAEVVAVPARRIGDVDCAKRPLLCAQIVSMAAVAAARAKKKVHALGLALEEARRLEPLLGRAIHSFDTTAYRMAVSKRVRVHKRPGGPGGFMVEPGMEETYLAEWLRRLLFS